MTRHLFVLHPEEVEDLAARARNARDPRREKVRDYRSGGYRHWPSKSSRAFRTGGGNFLQRKLNRQARQVPVTDEEGEGIIPSLKKTVDWFLL